MADPVSSIGGVRPTSLQPTGVVPPPVARPSILAPVGASKSAGNPAAVAAALANPDLPSWARDAIANPGARRSITQQISGVIGGIPEGIAHFAKSAAETVSGPTRATIDAFRGKLAPQDFMDLMQSNPLSKGSPRVEQLRQKYVPLATDTINSMEQTAGRVAQLSPWEVRSIGGRHVTTYGDAYRQGDIVGTGLGDLVNASIAGGLAGKALEAGAVGAEGLGASRLASGLGKAADVSSTVGRLAGRAGNAPLEATGGVLKGGASLWRQAGTAAADKIAALLPQEGPFSAALRSTPEGQIAGQAAKNAFTDPARGSKWMQVRMAKDAGLLGKAANRPSLLEQEVGLSRATGVAQANQMGVPQLGPEAALGAHVPIEEPGRTVTRAGQALHQQYHEGALPADQVARIDRVTNAYKRGADVVTRNALKGTGLLRGPMDPAYTGDQPLPAAVDMRLHAAAVSPQVITQMHDAIANGATWEDMAHIVPELAAILHDPQVYPKLWREAMNVTAKQTEAILHKHAEAQAAANDAAASVAGKETAARLGPLTTSWGEKLSQPDVERAFGRANPASIAPPVILPRTPTEMLAAGMERPTYMPSTTSNIGRDYGPATAPITAGFSSGIRSVANEYHAETVGHGRYSLATAAEGLAGNVSTTKLNSIIMNYVRHREMPTAAKILTADDPNIFTRLQTEAQQYAQAHVVGDATPGAIKALVAKRVGELTIQELQNRGYDVLHGDRANPQPGDFNPAKGADPMKVGPDSVVLPKGVKDRMVRYQTGAKTNRLLDLNQAVNSSFKRNVLAFNAHFTAGQVMHNGLLGWAAGGIDPVTMARGMMDIKHLSPEDYAQIFDRPNFVRKGIHMSTIDGSLNPDGSPMQRGPTKLGGTIEAHTGPLGTGFAKLGQGIRSLQDRSFRVNNAVTGLQREGYSLAKLERELRARGLSSTDAMHANPSEWQNPQVQSAINDVINNANKTFGTLDEMSPFERRTMQQVFPFWAWTRHITTLAARTAIDNPARILWGLRLGALGMNTSPQDMPSYLGGSFGWGKNQRINTRWMNPLYAVGGGSLIAPSEVPRELSPLIKFGITAATNRDAANNLNTITHAPKSHPNQVASALYQGAQTFPFARAAMNLAPTVHVPGTSMEFGPVKRYGSGQSKMDAGTGTPLSGGSRRRMVGSLFNLPMPATYVPVSAQGHTATAGFTRKGLLASATSTRRGLLRSSTKRGLLG